jgi:hypothetical protein
MQASADAATGAAEPSAAGTREGGSASARAGERRGLALALALLGASLLVLPLLALRQPTAGQEVALLFPPGTGRDAALAALDPAVLRAVRAGGADNVLVVRPRRDLAWREVWGTGALAAFDPLAFGSCLVSWGVER